MTASDELIASIKREIKDYDDFLTSVKGLVDLVPQVTDLKMEAEAKLILVENLPIDLLDESSPMLLQLQNEEEEERAEFLPIVPKEEDLVSIMPSSGTSSDFFSVAIVGMDPEDDPPEWAEPITIAFNQVADTKARKVAIPRQIEQVSEDLAKQFEMAVDSVDKAKGGVLGVDQAAIRMRDVIEQLWGSLAERARADCPEEIRIKHLELKKEAHRQLAGHCLGGAKGDRLTSKLGALFRLHGDLSAAAKKIGEDGEVLDQLYTRWALSLDEILRLVNRARDG